MKNKKLLLAFVMTLLLGGITLATFSENSIFQLFQKPTQTFRALGQNQSNVQSESIISGKKQGGTLSSSEFNRVLEALLETKIPIGQSCNTGSFINGFENNGDLQCNNKVTTTTKSLNENYKSALENSMRAGSSTIALFGTNEETASIQTGKASGATLSAAEFNRIIELAEQNLQLLDKECPINTALQGIANNGGLICGNFGGTVQYPTHDNTLIRKNKLTNTPPDQRFTLLGQNDHAIEVESINQGKEDADTLSSGEFNRILELLVLSENMVGKSCNSGKLAKGFDANGNIICDYVHEWVTGNWSTTCGNATRSVQCQTNTGTVVASGLCTDTQPSDAENQGSPTCGWGPSWTPWSGWGPCSPSCGNGSQTSTRSRLCSVSTNCAGPTPKETRSQACNAGPCATCTDGIQNGTETGIDCGGTCGSCGMLIEVTRLDTRSSDEKCNWTATCPNGTKQSTKSGKDSWSYNKCINAIPNAYSQVCGLLPAQYTATWSVSSAGNNASWTGLITTASGVFPGPFDPANAESICRARVTKYIDDITRWMPASGSSLTNGGMNYSAGTVSCAQWFNDIPTSSTGVAICTAPMSSAESASGYSCTY